jgi:cell division protein FtsI (penicillin-binding protein 3)
MAHRGQSTTSEDRKRLAWLSLFVFFLFSLLIVQFYRIQIIEGDKWTKEAELQHHLTVIEPFKRGLFYSNTTLKAGHPDQLQPFVIDVPKFHLYADPESIPSAYREEITRRLAQFLNLENKETQKLDTQFYKKSHSRKLAAWIDRDLRDQIQDWWLQYVRQKKIARNALFFVQDYKRSYPFGKLLGQVLHTIRQQRDELTHQSIPTGGLEMVFNKYLMGKEGRREIVRSPRHPLETSKIISYPEDGADVHLTINHYIQAIAEEEIEKAVRNANANGGWAVMMDPKTGEILALAQYPWFDPSSYSHFFNDDQLKEHTKVKAVSDPYEPGSTIKPITLAIALKANAELKKRGRPPLFSPNEKIATSNHSFPGRSKPLKDLGRTHYYLNMNMGLQKSSNVYMARLTQKVIETLGSAWYRKALQDIFGFGIKTDIELPGESSGLLPTPGKKHPNGHLEWSGPTPYSLAIGHNILVNSFQMLRSYAILANGGYDVHPTLVRKIVKTHRDGTQEILLDNTGPERVKAFARLLEPEIVDEVIKAMKFVTKPGGSAPKGDVYGYTEAGKTATTEKIINGTYSKKDHISTFIGFAPAKNARFVILIAIDDPEFKYIPGVGKNQLGGQCAAPAFREIASRTLQYLGVEPDDPYGYPAGDPRYDPEKADWVKKSKELKELYLQWNEHIK